MSSYLKPLICMIQKKEEEMKVQILKRHVICKRFVTSSFLIAPSGLSFRGTLLHYNGFIVSCFQHITKSSQLKF